MIRRRESKVDSDRTPDKAKDKEKDKAPDTSVTGMEQDTLSRKQMRSLYGYTQRQLRIDDDLFNLFQRAWKGQWNKEQFDSEVEQLDWYRKNKASIREYQLLSAEGGADFEQKKLDAQEFVRKTAMEMGRNLSPEEIASLAEDSMLQGWGEPGRDYELKRAIVDAPMSEGETLGGTLEEYANKLRAVSLANNVKIDDKWIQSKAKSAASGLSTIEDAESELREWAAQKTPYFADRIRSGEDLDALVSPWRRTMIDEWELADVKLDDPMLMSAIGGYDEKGNPKAEDLGAFQTRLRKDDRWVTTAQGQNKRIDAYSGVLRMFGYGN